MAEDFRTVKVHFTENLTLNAITKFSGIYGL